MNKKYHVCYITFRNYKHYMQPNYEKKTIFFKMYRNAYFKAPSLLIYIVVTLIVIF